MPFSAPISVALIPEVSDILPDRICILRQENASSASAESAIRRFLEDPEEARITTQFITPIRYSSQSQLPINCLKKQLQFARFFNLVHHYLPFVTINNHNFQLIALKNNFCTIF